MMMWIFFTFWIGFVVSIHHNQQTVWIRSSSFLVSPPVEFRNGSKFEATASYPAKVAIIVCPLEDTMRSLNAHELQSIRCDPKTWAEWSCLPQCSTISPRVVRTNSSIETKCSSQTLLQEGPIKKAVEVGYSGEIRNGYSWGTYSYLETTKRKVETAYVAINSSFTNKTTCVSLMTTEEVTQYEGTSVKCEMDQDGVYAAFTFLCESAPFFSWPNFNFSTHSTDAEHGEMDIAHWNLFIVSGSFTGLALICYLIFFLRFRQNHNSFQSKLANYCKFMAICIFFGILRRVCAIFDTSNSMRFLAWLFAVFSDCFQPRTATIVVAFTFVTRDVVQFIFLFEAIAIFFVESVLQLGGWLCGDENFTIFALVAFGLALLVLSFLCFKAPVGRFHFLRSSALNRIYLVLLVVAITLPYPWTMASAFAPSFFVRNGWIWNILLYIFYGLPLLACFAEQVVVQEPELIEIDSL